MSLFAIADLHLSLGVNKPMDVFSGWEGYLEKIVTNWKAKVKEEDFVVVAGDLSWGMNLEESRKDFELINSLPGTKILLKGNHDYYFSTKRKLEAFFEENGFKSLKFLFNNSYEYGEFSICGTRGWVNMSSEPEDLKILKREAGRLKLSLESATKEPIVFLHYPPIFCKNKSEEILQVLKEFNVKNVFYGHLHDEACKFAIKGNIDGIKYDLISSDHLNFDLIKILD